MSEGAEHDLTGHWTGIFNYPELLPPNSFEAELRDIGGSISGVTSEVDDDPHGHGATLQAVIEGRRDGSAVLFTKIYDELMPEPVVISYEGTIDPGGDEIVGRWDRPGHWAGTFLMVRNGSAGVEAEAEATATVDVPTA